MTAQNPNEITAALRQRAEQRLQMQISQAVDVSLEDAKKLIHDLHVHQIELELQNEELRATQLDLEASRLRYSDLYEFSPIGLLTLDSHERIQEANLTFVAMLALDREKIISRNLSDFVEGSTQDAYHFFYQGLRAAQQPKQCEISLLRHNQPALIVRLHATALSQPGESAVYRVAATDVTLQKQAEAQRDQLTAERQRTKVLADFVRDISHDFRTPLTVIGTGLYLIGKTDDKAQQLRKIEMLNTQLFYLTQVLDQLQQMAVLDSTVELELRAGNINQHVAAILHMVRSHADLKGVKLVDESQSDLPAIPLHSDKLHQVLRILIDNAIQFTPSGGVITVTTALQGADVVITVADTGVGISADALPHIFERFFKADESRHLSGGAGLGLPMALRIVELHHGVIEVSSTPGVTTLFTVRLPVAGTATAHRRSHPGDQR
ncbi:MAG: HAMP domain-containing sensor histidine kinase [Chloroflexota bacterium]|nr:HAMP domain-containing sensor histidine kinase [Chloroflexota bacterium]